MRAGKLRHEIDLEQYSETQDGTGDPVKGWTAFASGVWASIDPLTGREAFAAAQVLASVTHRVRLRYVAGVNSKMRVKYGSRYFRILEVKDLEERNRELELLCEEIVGGVNE